MVDAVTLYTYFYIIAVGFFGIGAVVLAYRLTRITGVFRGWAIMIAGVFFVFLQAVAAFVELVLFLPQQKLAVVIDVAGVPFFTFTILGVALSATLFLAMYDLLRTFREVFESRHT